MMRPQRTPAKTPRSRNAKQNLQTEPVKVYCRLRYVEEEQEDQCVEVINNCTVRLATSDGRNTEFQFSEVFNQEVHQPELFKEVCQPMVDGILKGKSGLLFTYGVTSSGKTYTMTGTLGNPGILPRSLDMIFNSIENVQAEKYTFIPDGMNGFNIQSDADIMLTKQERDILPRNTTPMKTPNRNRNKGPDRQYDIVFQRSESVNADCRYAVFVSYVEIYNDYVYDLLEEAQYDPFQRPKPPQSKRLREDKSKNMFVYGGNEVEVKSTAEAFEVFKRGSERRRIAHTQLNAESSRSHSIFNIRIVQAPLDSMGEDLLQEKSLICISQLALVDLAGSERLSRTRAGGERLREAGNINSSLMTLRRCLEQLRENQTNNGNEHVKYRNSKVTYLFKNFFEGRGQVKMVICVNPRKQESDENFYVMQFAEMAQQVEVAQQDEFEVDKESIRQKAEEEKRRKEDERRRELTATRKLRGELSNNSLFQKGKQNCRRNLSTTSVSSDTPSTGTTDSEVCSTWNRPSYWNLPPLPSLEGLGDFHDNETIPNFIDALTRRLENRGKMEQDRRQIFAHCMLSIRNLTEKESDNAIKSREYRSELEMKNKDNARMEKQIKKLENKILVLQRTTDIYEKDKHNLKDELTRAELQLKESKTDNRKLESRMRGAVANTRAQYEKEMGQKVRRTEAEMQGKILMRDERLKQLKSIMTEGRTSRRFTPSSSVSSSQETTPRKLSHKRRSRSADNLLAAEIKAKSLNKSRHISTSDYNLRNAREPKKTTNHAVDPALPVAPKHRRSKSGTGDHWLAHKPVETLQTDTILQPHIKPSKITHNPSPKDIKNASKYLLTHQKEDRQGEIETQLIKGDVIRTRTGGQQVHFNDIEILKTRDPNKKNLSPKKRKSDVSVEELSNDSRSSWTDVETRCSTAIENKAGTTAGPTIRNYPKRKK